MLAKVSRIEVRQRFETAWVKVMYWYAKLLTKVVYHLWVVAKYDQQLVDRATLADESTFPAGKALPADTEQGFQLPLGETVMFAYAEDLRWR